MSNDAVKNHGSGNRLGDKSGNFWYLFVGLLLMLLSVPFSTRVPMGEGRYSIMILFTLFMLVAIWSLSESRHIFRLGILLVLSIVGVVGVNALSGSSHALDSIGLLLMLIFCSLSCFIAARNVFVWHRVDLNSLVGAFCVYLLLGMIWALLYRLLYINGWAAFTGNIAEQDQFPDLLYFSFVTLASLGFGDIVPIGSLPKTLAYLEAVVGQFYLAVMVASLVGIYSTGRKRE
ncbi:MAG: ion channel [Methylomonas sp.]